MRGSSNTDATQRVWHKRAHRLDFHNKHSGPESNIGGAAAINAPPMGTATNHRKVL